MITNTLMKTYSGRFGCKSMEENYFYSSFKEIIYN